MVLNRLNESRWSELVYMMEETDYDSSQSSGEYRLSFSWNEEEYVILSHITEGVLEKKRLGTPERY